MSDDLREQVARAIAKAAFLHEQHRGYICQSVTFDDGWIASKHYEMADAAIAEIGEPAPSVREAARVLRDALNEESELDDVIQTAMQEEADIDGTDEWVFVLRAGLRAIAEGKDDE